MVFGVDFNGGQPASTDVSHLAQAKIDDKTRYPDDSSRFCAALNARILASAMDLRWDGDMHRIVCEVVDSIKNGKASILYPNITNDRAQKIELM